MDLHFSLGVARRADHSDGSMRATFTPHLEQLRLQCFRLFRAGGRKEGRWREGGEIEVGGREGEETEVGGGRGDRGRREGR